MFIRRAVPGSWTPVPWTGDTRPCSVTGRCSCSWRTGIPGLQSLWPEGISSTCFTIPAEVCCAVTGSCAWIGRARSWSGTLPSPGARSIVSVPPETAVRSVCARMGNCCAAMRTAGRNRASTRIWAGSVSTSAAVAWVRCGTEGRDCSTGTPFRIWTV